MTTDNLPTAILICLAFYLLYISIITWQSWFTNKKDKLELKRIELLNKKLEREIELLEKKLRWDKP